MVALKASRTAGLILGITGLFGLLILTIDQVLWASAPLHAYILILFVVIDFAAAAFALSKPSVMALRIAAAWSGLRIILQIGDIFTAPDFQLTYAQFVDYLFNPATRTPPNPTGVPAGLIDLIVILEIAVIALAVRERSTPQARPV